MKQGDPLCGYQLRTANHAGAKKLLVGVGLEKQQLQAFIFKKERGICTSCCMCGCSLVAI